MVTCLRSLVQKKTPVRLLHQPIVPIGANGFTLRAQLKSTDFGQLSPAIKSWIVHDMCAGQVMARR